MKDRSPPSKIHPNFMIDFTLGGIAAALSKTSFAPIERVKLLLQTQDIIKVLKYKGMTDCFLRIMREEGVISLWRGNFSNILRYFPTQALNFALNEKYHSFFCPYDPHKNPWKFLFGSLLTGGVAGISSLVFIYPLDFVRTRLAVDVAKSEGKREFSGINDCMLKIYHSDGIHGIYRGFVVSSMTYFFYRAIYFGGYNSMKKLFIDDLEKNCLRLKVAAALVVTNVAGFIIYPFDTIRRRLMMQSGREDVLYKGTLDCMRKIWKNEGGLAFYKGGFSNVIRNTGSSLILVMYDEFQKIFSLKQWDRAV